MVLVVSVDESLPLLSLDYLSSLILSRMEEYLARVLNALIINNIFINEFKK